MDTVSPPHTRSRSRSKTPFIPTVPEDYAKSSENADQQREKKRSPVRKEPTVQTIQEVEEPSQTPAKRSKRETKSTNVSPNEGTSGKSQQSSVSSSTVVVTSTTKVVTRGEAASATSSVQQTSTATPKRDMVNQKEFNRGLEGSYKKISTPRNNKATGSVAGSTNGNLSEHIAYKEYKDAGEYWNKFPKTDYTYSKLSPHRREIIPGVIAMPNMSRKSLEKHKERVNLMALQNPSQESYIRARYESSRFAGAGRALHYDSGEDEMDLSQFDRRKYTQVYRETVFKRIYTRIITTIVTSWYWISRPFRASEKTAYYTDVHQSEQQKSIFRRLSSAIGNSFMYAFQRVYLLIAWILLLDTWLLQSKTEGGRHKKKFLWFLILLLPFLLFGALALSEEQKSVMQFLPLSLGWLPSIFPSSASTWREYLPNLNQFAFLLPSSQERSDESANFKQYLTAEEYAKLLSHINQYIEAMVIKKDNERTSSEKLTVLIDKIVQENIVMYKYQLTEEDIERIVMITLERLKTDKTAGLQINQDVINKITLSIRDQFEGESKTQTDEIIVKILQSNRLVEMMEERFKGSEMPQDTSKYDELIAKLSLEISNIRQDLVNRANRDEDINFTLESMKSQQENIADQLYDFRRESDDRFDKLLSDIDVKIAAMSDSQYSEIDKHIRRSLVQIFNINQGGGEFDESDLRAWIKNLFVAKEYLEARLNDVQSQFSGQMAEEIQLLSGIIMKNITDTLRVEMLSLVEGKMSGQGLGNAQEIDVSEDHVRRIVWDALRVYDADKTGLVDYALESAGGQVLSTRCTESYHTKTAQISIFGIPLWYPSNTPRTAISPSVQPGNCWAFQGFPGFLLLKLNLPILVTGFTMEHIPKSLAPNGQIDSAPKGFSVWGLTDEGDQEPLLFGKYIYEDSDRSLQYFPVENQGITRLHQLVELRIESNHDNPMYTCLYRFRVHGTPRS
ncbi:klaroid protein [Phlebotomus argentipes]|uniref:klaroid protein n=1 Tax=Phlebotomus argentipes TaxID=94469 RepID=UPI002893108E|nr:klaroid protein [Phlebotomus argentipes]